MVKVSIIVPTFNVEEYLVECMDSIIRQTLKEIEIICVNDGSTDSSLEILKSYAKNDSRVIIVDKENGGYGMAMNVGLAKATGEYVGIVEPDDFVPLNMYEDLYNVAKEKELDFVKADFYRFTREEDGDMQLFYNHLDETGENYNQIFNPSQKPEATRYIMNTWSGIYRRGFLESNNIRHHETAGASFQDNGFFFKTFVLAQRAMILDKPYYMNRRDNPNSSVKSPNKVYCMNIEYDYIRDFLMEDKERWERFKYAYNRKRFIGYSFTLKRIALHYKHEYILRISAEFKRAMELGEVDLSIFSSHRREKFLLLVKEPETFYQIYVVKSDKELEKMRNSTTFKVGKIVMFVPIAIKKTIKKVIGK